VIESAWQSLVAAERQVLKSAIESNGVIQDNEILAQESKLADTFKAGGMTVIQPDIESFRKPVLASLPAKFESKWGKGLWERIAAA
jgi:TRAP-type C4-dicarboxylate transport system substrate-binding protein